MAQQKSDDIALALLTRAESLQVPDPVDGGFLPVAMPEVAPPWGEGAAPDRYLRVSIFDNVPRWVGVDGSQMGQGILQVEVVWPRGQGVISIRAAAQAVLNHFPAALVLREGSARVKVQSVPSHGTAFPTPDGMTMLVSIPWDA